MLGIINGLNVVKVKDNSSNTHFIPLDKILDMVIFKEYYAQGEKSSYRIKICLFGGDYIKLGKSFETEGEAEEFLKNLFL